MLHNTIFLVYYYIGIKTTKIRSQSGELIIIPNEEMTSAIIAELQRSIRVRRSVVKQKCITCDSARQTIPKVTHSNETCCTLKSYL